MSKLKLSLLFFIGGFFILIGFSQRHALACEFIEYSNYSEIAPNIFVSGSFDLNQKENLLSNITLGKSRVNTTFGQMISNPKVVITTSDSEASDFDSNKYGKALLTPLGKCIVLGSEGQNIDVIAHEYTHAEVHYRVGWLNHLLNVPIWFNEGVALLVDFRKPYLLENIGLSPKDAEFVKNNEFDFSIGSYQASRVLVDKIDKASLYQNLEKLKQGQDINSVFAL
ncbi:hypothetical protein ACM9HF_02975 [Colwellia sp. RE-S-Sl-9]